MTSHSARPDGRGGPNARAFCIDLSSGGDFVEIDPGEPGSKHAACHLKATCMLQRLGNETTCTYSDRCRRLPSTCGAPVRGGRQEMSSSKTMASSRETSAVFPIYRPSQRVRAQKRPRT